MKKLISVLSLAALVSCATEINKVKIPIPEAAPEIKLTVVQDGLLWTTYPAIYRILGARDSQCHARVEYLEGLIQAYNQ